MSERKEMSTEMRSLLAAVLCLLVIAGWSLIYKPPQPPPAELLPPLPRIPSRRRRELLPLRLRCEPKARGFLPHL